ncbi:type II toxin-antitoxin system VapC family toxin [soil metagenome]
MIGYLDTSVFVPLLVAEPSTEACQRFWDDADAAVSSRLAYVETAAALAQAWRMDRLTDEEHEEALALLGRLWSEIDVAEVDEIVVSRAAVLARRFSLRGYDAVHCASAEQLNDDDVVVASGDHRLLAAWVELGMATFDSNATLESGGD